MHVSERTSWNDHIQPIHESKYGSFIRFFDFKTENRAEQTGCKKLFDSGSIGMLRIRTIIDALNAWMFIQPFCEGSGVITLALEAQRQSLNATHCQVTL